MCVCVRAYNYVSIVVSGNTEENKWESFEELPKGGYLDDLWYYDQDYKHGRWVRERGRARERG